MKNWNTDVTKFRTAKEKKIWELTQKIEYGLDGEVLSKKEVATYWDDIKDHIDPENRRMWEFFLWGKRYSLPVRQNFWTAPQPLK